MKYPRYSQFNELPTGTVESSEQNHDAGAAMYGLIGKMTAVSGQRDTLAAVMLEGTTAMPGCLSYVIAHDPSDPDALWLTEVWESKESHAASLTLPAVKGAIAAYRRRMCVAGTCVRRGGACKATRRLLRR